MDDYYEDVPTDRSQGFHISSVYITDDESDALKKDDEIVVKFGAFRFRARIIAFYHEDNDYAIVEPIELIS